CRGRRVAVVARRAWLVSLLVMGAFALLSACDWPWSSQGGSSAPTPVSSPGPRRIRFLADTSTSIGLQLEREAATHFSRQTGIEVDIIAGAASTSGRLAQSELYLMAQSPDVDVYEIDVIWPGILANDLLDLSQYISKSQI